MAAGVQAVVFVPVEVTERDEVVIALIAWRDRNVQKTALSTTTRIPYVNARVWLPFVHQADVSPLRPSFSLSLSCMSGACRKHYHGG